MPSEIRESWQRFWRHLVRRRYAERDPKTGEPLYDDYYRVVRRVAHHARQQLETGDHLPTAVRDYLAGTLDAVERALESRLVIPSTPVLMNYGAPTECGCPFACFPVVPPQDSMDSILEVHNELVKIFKAGGGAGVDLSNLRPRGALVDNGQGYASGPTAFALMYAAAAEAVEQGGKRRGALMQTLDGTHPDVDAFMCLKDDIPVTHPLRTCNISVRFHGHEPEDLLRRVAEHAWKTGDPGAQFVDTQLRLSPIPSDADPTYSNPCSEYMSVAGTACNLFCLNLLDAALDTKTREEFLHLVSRMAFTAAALGNIILLTGRYPLDYIRIKSWYWKPVGVGFTGLHEAMAIFGVRYESEEGVRFAGQVQAALLLGTLKVSLALGRSVGNRVWEDYQPFQSSTRPTEGGQELLRACPATRVERHRELYQRAVETLPEEVWRRIAFEFTSEDVPYNAVTTTQMPGGTVSQIAGTVSTGLEPVWDLEFDRTVIEFDGEHRVRLKSRLLEEKPEAVELLTPSLEVPWQWQLKVMKAVSDLCHTAVSKTVNVPHDTPVEDVIAIFEEARRAGLKACTVFRDGCKDFQILESKAKAKTKDTEASKSQDLPAVLPAKRYKVRDAFINTYVLVSEDQSHQPRECFILKGKAGTRFQASMEALGRLISLVLRLAPDLRDELCEQLSGIDDATPVTLELAPDDVRRFPSIYDCLAFLLQQRAVSSSDVRGAYDVCPKCGEPSLMRAGSCLTCRNCDYSTC